ncbi:MAG TPA: sialidase family protein [Thermoplasmata archaeon]
MVVNKTGTVFVGWKETTGAETAGYRVGASYSTDQGNTWAPNILMNQTHSNQNCRDSDPWMDLDPNDRVHFAYLEYDPNGGSSPPCSSGFDVSNTTNGQDWGGVHYIQGFGGLVDKDSITFDSSGRLYATWDEGNVLALTWSDDDGNHWAPIRNPGNVSLGVIGAVVGTFGTSSVYLTWWDFSTDNIMFEASNDRGQTWGPQIRVNSQGGSAQQVGPWQIPIPAMNVDPNSGGIAIAWPDSRNGNQDILFAYSTDGGATWGTNHKINDDAGSTSQWMVDLAIDSTGKVHAAWEDGRTGAWNIFYANSTDRGATWTTNLRVSSEDTSGSYNRPGDYFSLQSGPNDYIYVVWTDGRGQNFDIYYARNPGFPGATLTASTNPAGLKVQIDGVTYTSPAQKTVVIGSVHTIGAPDPQPPSGSTSRYLWTSWSDGGAQTHSLTMDNDTNVVATFKKQFLARFAASQPGPYILVDNVSYGAPASLWWDQGTAHWLEAPSPQPTGNNSRFVFVSWNDGGGRAHRVTANKTINTTATFQPERALVIQTDPQGLNFTLDGLPPQSAPATFWLNLNSTHSVAVDTLQAGAPGVRYRFLEWKEDHGAPSHNITMGTGITLTARFKTEFFLTVVSRDPLSTGQDWYIAGSPAQATISNPVQTVGPGERLQFKGWGGDATGSGTTSDIILMDGPKTAIAIFGTQYYLDVQSQYGVVSGSGWYFAGDIVNAIAPATLPLSSGSRRAFNGWSDGASGSGTTSDPIVMNGPKVATANWKLQYSLRIDTAYGTALTAGWYDAGAQTSARLNVGTVSLGDGARAQFQGWFEDASGTDSTGSSTILMDRPHLVVAVWQVQYYLTVETPYGTGSGSGWYANGSFGLASVNASIVPISGTQREAFDTWAGDASGSSGALSNPMVMDGPKTAHATWHVEYLVRVTSDVPIDAGGWYAAGTQATLRAPQEVAYGGQTYRFSGWTGDVTSSAIEVSVTVNGPLVVHANWATVGILGSPTVTYSLIVVIVVIAIVIALVVARSRRRRE